MSDRIILGTAKFGINNYGFSSSGYQASHVDIFDLAYKYGVRALDTSPRYNNAENLIGDYHKKSKNVFKVSTKVDNLEPESFESEKKIYNSVLESIKRTGVNCIDTLYLHQNEMGIISDTKIINALKNIKNDGFVKKIGVSIYNNEECKFSLDSDIYDVIQLPVSVLDSFMYSELIHSSTTNKKIIARSIFLQGVLFNRDLIKSKVKQSENMLNYISKLDQLALEHKVELFMLACSYVLSLPKVNGIIVGTAVKENLLSIIESSKFKITSDLMDQIYQLSSEYKEWGNPRKW